MRAPRQSHRRLGSAIAITALAFGIIGFPAAAAGTVVVDRDGAASIGDCDAGATVDTSIQDAIDAAAPGTTILVCPGTYRERLSIGAGKNGLTLRAVKPFAAAIRIPAGIDAESLVHIDGADGVEIRGLSLVSGSGASCGRVDVAILVRDAQDAVIRGNRIRPSTTDTINACGFPYGIAIGAPGVAISAPAPTPPASAFVGWNLVRDPLFGGLIISGQDTSATVQRNSVRYWHLAESAPAATRLKPSGINGVFNTVGIGIEQGADAVLTGNAVSSGPNADLDDGGITPVAVRRASPAGSATPALVEGIAADEAGTVRVADSVVQRVRIGISITASGPTRVVENRVTTVRAGIRAASDGARYLDNTIAGANTGIVTLVGGQILRRNAISGSSRVDCLDETTGSGTLGTANTWGANTGATSYPVGICGSGAPDIAVTFIATVVTGPAVVLTPSSVIGTFPGSPLALAPSAGTSTGTTDLPLGGSYTYNYRDQFGTVEGDCGPLAPRPLVVVNEGGLQMMVEDNVDFGQLIAAC